MFAGGVESLVRARKQYAISLQHQSATHNLRAVYGVLYTSRALSDLYTTTEIASSSSGSAAAVDK